MEKTLALIKPDSVEKKHIGEIITMIENSGLKIVAMEHVKLTKSMATSFYNVHIGKPFFEGLLEYMTSGPIVGLVLSGDNAILRWRELMGATNPKQAAKGTIRAKFGASITNNAVHGSDAVETANYEISYIFGGRSIDGKID
jgi:nucleoside-diphosphate kinase